MTGPATYASPILTQERPVLNLPRDIASLRAECKKRKIEFSGNKQEVCQAACTTINSDTDETIAHCSHPRRRAYPVPCLYHCR